jgi:hypothetical protein
VIDETLKATRPTGKATGAAMQSLIRDAVYVRTVEAMLRLAGDPHASAVARGVVMVRLAELKATADRAQPKEMFVSRRIEEFEREPEKFAPAKAVTVPPGMPIGDGDDETF